MRCHFTATLFETPANLGDRSEWVTVQDPEIIGLFRQHWQEEGEGGLSRLNRRCFIRPWFLYPFLGQCSATFKDANIIAVFRHDLQHK